VYVGSELGSDRVFAVTQLDYDTGTFDEVKFVIGVHKPIDEVAKLYQAIMTPQHFGGIVEITKEEIPTYQPQTYLMRRGDAIKPEHVAAGVGAAVVLGGAAYLLSKGKGKSEGQKCGRSYISANYQCQINQTESTAPNTIRQSFEKAFEEVDLENNEALAPRLNALKKRGLTDDEALAILHYIVPKTYEKVNQVLFLSKEDYKARHGATDEDYENMLEVAAFTSDAVQKLPKFSANQVIAHENKVCAAAEAAGFAFPRYTRGQPLIRTISFDTKEQSDAYMAGIAKGQEFQHKSFMSTTTCPDGLSFAHPRPNKISFNVVPKNNTEGRMLDIAMNNMDQGYIGEVLFPPGTSFKVKKIASETIQSNGWQDFSNALKERYYYGDITVSVPQNLFQEEHRLSLREIVQINDFKDYYKSELRQYTGKKPAPEKVISRMNDFLGIQASSILEVKKHVTNRSKNIKDLLKQIDADPDKYFKKAAPRIVYMARIEEL
jgi:hypothetical protein